MRAVERNRGSFWLFCLITMIEGGIFTDARCSAQHEIFNKSVLQKWAEYEAFSHNLQGTRRATFTTASGKARTNLYRYEQNRECALSIVPGREPGTEICWLTNPRYSAGVKRNSSDRSNVVLERFDPRLIDKTEKDIRTAIDGVFSGTSPHFYYSQSRLSQLVLSPTFKVVKVVKERDNGQELIRVDHTYSYDAPGSNKNHEERIRGSLYFDPARCWCLRRCKDLREGMIRGEHRVDFEHEVEYETIDHPSGFPIIKSETQHNVQVDVKTKKRNDHKSRFEYELEVKEGPPNEEFTLTAFGLPEPSGEPPVKKPIPMYVWFLITAGACGAIAFAFRYLARRRHRAAT